MIYVWSRSSFAACSAAVILLHLRLIGRHQGFRDVQLGLRGFHAFLCGVLLRDDRINFGDRGLVRRLCSFQVLLGIGAVGDHRHPAIDFALGVVYRRLRLDDICLGGGKRRGRGLNVRHAPAAPPLQR